MFLDRREAGRRLAQALAPLRLSDPVVLALPRGGVPVGFEVAQALGASLDVLLVRKIGAPGDPEYGIGAVVGGAHPQVVLNEEAIRMAQPSRDYVEAEKQRQLQEISRRRAVYLGDRDPVGLSQRTAIIVDDGIATGGTVRVALKAVRSAGAARLIVAVPVAPKDVFQTIREEADHAICLCEAEDFQAVGFYYADFGQTSDEEVIALLGEAVGSSSFRPRRGEPTWPAA